MFINRLKSDNLAIWIEEIKPYDSEVEYLSSNDTLPYIDLDASGWIEDNLPWDFDIGFRMIDVDPS